MEAQLRCLRAVRKQSHLLLKFAAISGLIFFLFPWLPGCKKSTPPSDGASSAGAAGSAATSSASDSPCSSAATGGSAASGSRADRLNAIYKEGSSGKSAPIVLPDWKPVSANTSSMTIPLVEGLVQTSVISDQHGDHESVHSITDILGDSGFNRGLSERGAATEKNALAIEYKVVPERPNPSGYGASQPSETNKTVEGRARNRRVELQRA